MKNFLLGILFMAVLIAVGLAAYQFGKGGFNKTSVTPTVTPAITLPVTTSAPSPTTEALVPTAQITPTPENISESIKAALMKKNNWPSIEGTLKINNNDGTYASGSLGGSGGGGYWFAKKVNGVWVIVADGNGVITCEEMAPYPDYPKSLIPECYDEASGKSIAR